MYKRLALMVTLVIMVLTLSNCATAPKLHVFDSSRNMTSDYDKVWGAVISFFASRNIPIMTIEKESGIIMSQGQSFPGDWVDCGGAALLEIRGVTTGNFNVFVTKDSNGKVNIRVNTSFTGEFNPTGNGRSRIQQCNSTGIFETLILDYVSDNS